MDITQHRERPQKRSINRPQWRFIDQCLVIVYIISLLILQCNCHSLVKESSQTEILTKTDFKNLDVDNIESNHCHSCQISRNNENSKSKDESIYNEINTEEQNEKDELGDRQTNFIDELLSTVTVITKEYLVRSNKTQEALEQNFEDLLDKALSKDRYEIFDGVVLQTARDQNEMITPKAQESVIERRALFSKFTLEYRLYNKIKNFIDTHVLSINLPKAARLIGFRSFGLKKILLPIIVGAQIFKGILFAMFLPSILGSFGKILGKGISQLSASSSQASYPPAQNMDDQDPYNENKDIMAYETDPTGMYAYPQDEHSMYTNMADANDVNNLGQVDLSRLTPNAQKMSYLPTKNSYYKNQMQSGSSNNYKVFQKIPASSMILSNYDPFYSPLLSRLDGIFARLGLAPSENLVDPQQIGGQSLSDVKLEACREQLICLMYASPAKYAPYSNLVSAQLSRELNDLRRPVSDNPEILRFFRYMRAARRGQEGVDCMRAHPGCASVASPSHTMIAAFHDINKLVTARKLKN